MYSHNALTYLLIFVLAVIVDLIILYQWRGKWSSQAHPRPTVFGPLLTRAVGLAGSLPWGTLVELSLIILWAAWVSSPLLNTPPSAVPKGGEFSNLTQTHFIWTLLPRCGLCFLWNGSINGGAPAFAELSGAVLHPLVFIPVLFWGVVQGAKITFAAGLVLAGIAQWGLARKLGLGWWPRMWSAFLIVVGGHLSGKMENAGIGLVLGQACAALALTYGVDLLFNRNRRSVIGLAIALTLTLLSGEGYIQVAVVFTLLPALALLCITRSKERSPAWKDYLLALGLVILLGGIFIMPLAHFFPQIGKNADTSLSNLPPLEYIPLNLVIRDLNFMRSQVLGKDPYLATHIIYIGWAPVLLAFLALRFTPARLTRLLWVFIAGILLVFLVTSIDLPKALLNIIPAVAALRHLTAASGLVVPFIVGLASISMDEILYRFSCLVRTRLFPALFSAPGAHSLAAAPGALLMIPVAILSIYPCYTLSQEFLGVREIDYLGEHMQAIQTASAQWIQPPYGFLDWTTQALARGVKIGYTWRPWYWKGRTNPKPYIEAVYLPKFNSPVKPDKQIGDYGFILHPADEYASITDPISRRVMPCQTTSQGGWIDVTCHNPDPGTLTVEENAWGGWYAWVDGQPVRLIPGRWLQAQAPAGTHHYRFRYLPWDVAFGALLTLSGIFISVYILYRLRRQH